MGNIAGGFETTAFPAINMENYIDYLTKTYNGPVRVPEPQHRYDIGDRIWAGYAQLKFKTATIRGTIGGRAAPTIQQRTSSDVTRGRSSCRERVCKSMWISLFAFP